MSVHDQFCSLIDFLISHQDALLDNPYRGNLVIIHCVYNFFCQKIGAKEVEPIAAFIEFLQQFNSVSGNALVFAETTYSQLPALAHIKTDNVNLLRVRLGTAELVLPKIGTAAIPKPSKDHQQALKRLQKILDAPLSVCSDPTAQRESQGARAAGAGADGGTGARRGFCFDLERLRLMMAQPTAATQLGVERAQMLTAKKPFVEVCEAAHHGQVLANLCLRSKMLANSIQDLPSNTKLHKVIGSCKSLMDKEAQSCVKTKIHFLPLVTAVTDVSLGNCSYLDTCHKLKSCRYLHYYTLNPPASVKSKALEPKPLLALDYTVGECHDTVTRSETPAQWINCDVRHLPFSILGKFSAIISDPAWDIHMSLPYGTCKDAELLSLPMNQLQDEGILMLWVTGRSIEIGRRALAQWGYSVSDEMIWIKLNQLRRTIVTGRTGHWLNHSKEHLLVGIKGNPKWINRKIDLDFIVSGTRETLRKPDELYGVVERLVGKHARKLEIFGRDHNIRPGWFSKYNRAFLST